MSDIAIRVENLSKLYRIGRAQERHDTLRDAPVAGIYVSLKSFMNIHNLQGEAFVTRKITHVGDFKV